MLAWNSTAVTLIVPGVALLLAAIGFLAIHIADRRFQRRWGKDR